MRFCWDSGDVGRKEISIFRDLFLAAYKLEILIQLHIILELNIKSREIFILILKILMKLKFSMVSFKTTLNTFELFVSHREFEFDKERALFIRKKLKKEAKKRYAQILMSEKKQILKIIHLLGLDSKKRGCIRVNLL